MCSGLGTTSVCCAYFIWISGLLKCLIGELGKRNGILQSAVSIAPIFSGFLQAGIYNGLNGHADLAGWRWLFGNTVPHDGPPSADDANLVVNGVISMPIAVAAYFFLPDTPGTAKPNWIFTKRVSGVYHKFRRIGFTNTTA
jgi:MFS family permease